jgi:hypothetical protein
LTAGVSATEVVVSANATDIPVTARREKANILIMKHLSKLSIVVKSGLGGREPSTARLGV